MPPTRALPLAAALILATSACADSIVSGGGEDELDQPLPEDAELRCPADEGTFPAFFGKVSKTSGMGPCGHFAFHDEQGQGWLISPDATSAAFEHTGWPLVFASTGDLLAWEPKFDGGVRLRDLLGGGERELIASGSVDKVGFVPSFADQPGTPGVKDPKRSAWAWTCEQGLLERHDLTTSEVIAESVVCGSVAGSSGSARLVYADQAGRVWLADLDHEVQIGSDDLEFAGYDGSARDDVLWIDHDGDLLIHVAVEWQGDDDADAEWPVELWGRVLSRRGETLLEAADGVAWRQAARRGAPVFVFDHGAAVRFDAGSPSSVAAEVARTELAESGELFFATPTDELFVAERSLEAPITSLGTLAEPIEIKASRSGNVVAIEHRTDICIVDEQSDCDRILLALRRWTRSSGFDDHVLYSTAPWELLATLDDGRMLVIGAPVDVDGPVYTGEQPERQVLLLSAQGEIQAELPAGHENRPVRQVWVIADDRVVFEYRDEFGRGSLYMAMDWGFVGFGNQDVVTGQAWIDARGLRDAYLSVHGDGEALNYNRPPR